MPYARVAHLADSNEIQSIEKLSNDCFWFLCHSQLRLESYAHNFLLLEKFLNVLLAAYTKFCQLLTRSSRLSPDLYQLEVTRSSRLNTALDQLVVFILQCLPCKVFVNVLLAANYKIFLLL